MKLVFAGAGYVGLVSGTCFSDLGNEVTCVDIDKNKVNDLKDGKITIYEPGLKDLFERNRLSGRLNFSSDMKLAIKDADAIFICVGTPSKSNGEADLSYVESVARAVGGSMSKYLLVINKSTVPPGTCALVKKIITEELSKRKLKLDFDVASNPEFLREGSAVKDFQNPDRIIVGVESEKAKEILEKLYRPITRTDRPIIFTDPKDSEMIKYASNAMLAARISFMNELANYCEAIGADIKVVSKGIGFDSRIGSRFLQAGCGYGGSCFPKDVKALKYMLEASGVKPRMLSAIDEVNDAQKLSIVVKIKKQLRELSGKKIAIWGLSFKPRTDDLREAPSIVVIEELLKEHAKIVAYDPEGIENAKKVFQEKITYSKNSYDCLKDADALVILTEWDEFRQPDFLRIKKIMTGNLIIDGRNIYVPKDMKNLGFTYIGVGRTAS